MKQVIKDDDSLDRINGLHCPARLRPPSSRS